MGVAHTSPILRCMRGLKTGVSGENRRGFLGCLLKRWVPWIAGYVAGGERINTSHLAYRGCLRICAFPSLPLAICR